MKEYKKNKMTYIKNGDELKSHLKEQIQFLIKSSDAYDEGFKNEAKRLATIIRVLLHDTSHSVSLLNQLGKKDILFYDTADDYEPENLMSQFGLLSMTVGMGNEYIPRLDSEISTLHKTVKIPFIDWWEKIVIVDFESNKFSRKGLVLSVCEKDGGAHVDPELDDGYAKITRLGSLGWKTSGGEYLRNAELASIRQITHEVIKSLKDEFPNCF